MIEPTIVAEITFDALDEDVVEVPQRALQDVLELLLRLQPQAIVATLLLAGNQTRLELAVNFASHDAGKAGLLKTALIRAEGNTGFNATFLSRKSDVGESWLLAEAVLDYPTLQSGEPFAVPLPLDHSSPALLRRLRLADVRCGYRLIAIRSAGLPGPARCLAPALARCDVRGGAGAALLDPLRNAVRWTADEGWNVREGVCVSTDCTDSAAELVEDMIVDAVRVRYPFVPDQLVGVAWGRMEDLAYPSREGDDDWQRAIERRRDPDYVLRVISGALGAAGGEARPAKEPPTRPAAPTPPVPQGPFAFLSYAHRDRATIDRLRASLSGHPLVIWFDDEIHSGSVWDELLEQRIRQCALLIACVSPAYEASRYCRREIKFADHLRKPILPVAMQDYMWGEGLALMFQELQILRLGQGDWGTTLEQHAGQLVPAWSRA